jgi:hypothetical protein
MVIVAIDKTLFPITVRFDDQSEQVVDGVSELVAVLEWFDSAASDGSITIADRQGRPVSVLIEALELKRLETADSLGSS